MQRFLFFCFSSALLLTGCESPGTIEDISWLLGKWEGVDVHGIAFHERWNKANATTFIGAGCMIDTEKGDTLFKETLKIEVLEGVPYYVSTVPENPGPVHFKLIKGDATNAVFENKDHDFPQRISYKLETKNTLTAKLEGIKKGKPHTESLRFERVNDEILNQPNETQQDTFSAPPQQDTVVTIKLGN